MIGPDTRWIFFVCFLVGFLVYGGLAQGWTLTAPETPDPSYSDRWAELDSQSSPFLDLRNRTESDTTEDPERPDSPSVEDPSGTETPSESRGGTSDTSPRDESNEQNKSATKDQTDTDTKDDNQDTSAQDTTDESEVKDRTTSESEVSETINDDNREEPEPQSSPEDRENKPEESVQEQSADEPSDPLSNSVFAGVEPKDTTPNSIVPEPIYSDLDSGTIALGSVRSSSELAEANDIPPSQPPFWWRYYWWITAGVVVVVMIGMFFWFRGRRVRVVEREHPSAEDFFNDIKNDERSPRVEPTVSPEPEDSIGSTQLTDTENSLPDYRELADRLDQAGFDGEYAEILKLHYGDGMEDSEIAEQTSRGLGEIGLVIDFAERIRKDVENVQRT